MKNKLNSVVGVLAVLLLACIFAIPAHSQLAGANLSGLVSDTSGSPVPDFEQDFSIELFQDGAKINAQSTRVNLLYSEGVGNTYEVSGAIIVLRFDPEKVNPDDEVIVKVHTPDDQHVKATFDLGHLR